MERRREPSEEERAEAREGAPPPASPMAQQVLAMQRGAGNAAVGRMIARFYEDKGDGTYQWHDGEPGPEWEKSPNRYWWFKIWPQDTYVEKKKEPAATAPEAQEPEAQEGEAPAAETAATGKKKRRGGRGKRRGGTQAAAPADGEQQEVGAPVESEQPQPVTPAESEQPQPAESEQPQPAAPAAAKDEGFRSGSRKGRRKEIRRELPPERVAELVASVDGWTGAAKDVSEPFNQYFNMLFDRGELTAGTLQDAYISSWDEGIGFSVEIAIPRLNNWVAHAHLDRQGNVLPGDGATHYKKARERFDLGKSVSLSNRQVRELLPAPAACLAYARTATANKRPPKKVDW